MCITWGMCAWVQVSKETSSVAVHSKLPDVSAGNQLGPLREQGLIITFKTKWEFWNSAECICVKDGGPFWKSFYSRHWKKKKTVVFLLLPSFKLVSSWMPLISSSQVSLSQIHFSPERDSGLCQTLIFASIKINIPEFIKFTLVNGGLYWLIFLSGKATYDKPHLFTIVLNFLNHSLEFLLLCSRNVFSSL